MIMKTIYNHNKKIIYTDHIPVSITTLFSDLINEETKLWALFDEFLPYFKKGYKFLLNYHAEAENYEVLFKQQTKAGRLKYDVFSSIQQYGKVHELKNDFFQILTASMNIKELTNEIYRPYVQPVLAMHNVVVEIENERADEISIEEIQTENFTKKFTFLNGRIPLRFHRTSLFTILKGIGVLQNCNYSFNSRGEYREYPQISFESENIINSDNKERILGFGTKANYASFCNIVTETMWDYDYMKHYEGSKFISEKSYKPMAMLQPFVIAGPHQHLKMIKEFGFKTFSDWWDESYDDEINSSKRLSKVVKTIIDINNLSMDECKSIYKEMKPILLHNYNRMKDLTSVHYPEFTLPSVYYPEGNGIEYGFSNQLNRYFDYKPLII